MVDVGELAPDFSLSDQEGNSFSLSARRGRPIVLYFFPKAGTAGCRSETKGFAQEAARLAERDVQVVAISVDSVERQAEFARECGAPFPMLSDTDRAVARAYGVLGFLGFAKRVTFLLDAEGRVAEIVESFLPGPHLRAARARFLETPT
ncbi:MAG: peroxiredoxin [Thermoplasmata archaeon]